MLHRLLQVSAFGIAMSVAAASGWYAGASGGWQDFYQQIAALREPPPLTPEEQAKIDAEQAEVTAALAELKNHINRMKDETDPELDAICVKVLAMPVWEANAYDLDRCYRHRASQKAPKSLLREAGL